jgi:hypothetical protein
VGDGIGYSYSVPKRVCQQTNAFWLGGRFRSEPTTQSDLAALNCGRNTPRHGHPPIAGCHPLLPPTLLNSKPRLAFSLDPTTQASGRMGVYVAASACVRFSAWLESCMRMPLDHARETLGSGLSLNLNTRGAHEQHAVWGKRRAHSQHQGVEGSRGIQHAPRSDPSTLRPSTPTVFVTPCTPVRRGLSSVHTAFHYTQPASTVPIPHPCPARMDVRIPPGERVELSWRPRHALHFVCFVSASLS